RADTATLQHLAVVVGASVAFFPTPWVSSLCYVFSASPLQPVHFRREWSWYQDQGDFIRRRRRVRSLHGVLCGFLVAAIVSAGRCGVHSPIAFEPFKCAPAERMPDATQPDGQALARGTV